MEEVKVYDSVLITENGQVGISYPIVDRTKMLVPFKSINDDGTFESMTTGVNIVDNEAGFTFIVDYYVPDQFHKLKIDNSGFIPKLVVKDGEQLDDPTDENLRLIQEKEQELLRLKASLNQAAE